MALPLTEADLTWLRMACALAFQAPPSETAFAVGSVVVGESGRLLATGYSREWGEFWHAEAVALARTRESAAAPRIATLYSSLEPCSRRKSGRVACCDLLVAAGVPRVVFAAREPPVFVQGEGAATLARAGIEVLQAPALAAMFARANAQVLRNWPRAGAMRSPAQGGPDAAS